MIPAPAAATAASRLHPLEAVRTLRSAGGALLAQSLLHGQLARIEWEEEKHRLFRLLAFGLLGYACFLCVLLLCGALILATIWETGYRLAAFAGLILLSGAGMAGAWRRLQAWSALGSESFAASLDELAKDAALLKASL